VLRVLLVVFGLAVVIGGAIAVVYQRELQAHDRRLSGRSDLIQTTSGTLEYATKGEGPPLLMIHGTGGGFDQGLTFTDGLLPHRYTVVAPSRFGYLRSDFPSDASSERQADAFVELLDLLHIEKIPVAGGSAGALSAVQFALRHPDRTSALILLVPAANVRGTDPVQMTPLQEWMVRRLTTSNFFFWSATEVARDQMVGTVLATDPQLVEKASSAEQRRVDRILNEIMPVSRRWRGMLNDAKLAGDPARVDLTKLKVPTLIISAADDWFGTAATAEDIAQVVPGSKLIIYPTGGHVWVGRDRDVWEQVAAFLRANQGE
jgi:2-hydroxy-6-oxonona-2,4-dienedioate hydrolase